MIIVAVVCLILSAIACYTSLDNLRLYRPAPTSRRPHPPLSVLIPARNEESNIADAVRSALEAGGRDTKVIVGDDHSSDRTAELVRRLADLDPRISLIALPSLPAGWNGKQHACHVLAQTAEAELFLFMDADVRLEAGSIPRMVAQLEISGAHLLSGLPRQVCGSWAESLLIPLIHFVLLGYLPMSRMRRLSSPAYAAGCGQLFLSRAKDYQRSGGHAAIRASMHDGITLPRAFRLAGLKSDLFDATDVARCRMYSGAKQTLQGLSKNAIEGLAKPSRILIFSLLFVFGQVLPPILAALFFFTSQRQAFFLALAATAFAYLPRLLAVRRFEQPLWSALAHPVGMLALTIIQWVALVRHLAGYQPRWKGRSYGDPLADATATVPLMNPRLPN